MCMTSSLRAIVAAHHLKFKTLNHLLHNKVSQKELENQTVKFTVIDNGRPRKRQTIGHLLCSLKNISIENGKQVRNTHLLARKSCGSKVYVCYFKTRIFSKLNFKSDL
jgi:hypothetical protein